MPLDRHTRVVLTGAGGQLAGAIEARLSGVCALTALARPALDVTMPADVARVMGDLRPHAIVNCASYNDVDGAEANAATALAINGLALDALAEAANRQGALLVHFSTDFVFDPEVDPGPLDESAPVRPRSVYAQSKLLGEILARRAERHVILRVESLFGGQRAKSSLDRIARTLMLGGTVRAFADRTVTPSYVIDLAEATAAVLDGRVPVGLYHCVNSGATTWFELIRTVAREVGADPETAVTPVPFEPSAFPARRPKFAALSNAALAAHGVAMPTWQDAVARYVRGIRSASASS
jgi:dTDP-4-dehydrorhamnose reductase